MAFKLNYFSPNDCGQYSFFRIPKMLITDSRFKCISMEAKLLYGILLDRVSLSLNHGWVDENNHVYIIYTIEQIMSDMDCSNKKAIGLLKELEKKACLIEKKRQGLGKPNLIYVKNFLYVEEDEPDEDIADTEVKNSHSNNCKNATSSSDKTSFQEVTKVHGINTNNNKTDMSKTNLILSDVNDDENDEREHQEIRDYFYDSLDIASKIIDHPYQKDTLIGIIDLLTDVCCTKKSVIYICGEAKAASIVKNRLMKLNSGHIEYVIKCLDENTTHVKNMRQYMLAALYNAPTTIGPYYRSLVNSDMANQKV